MSNNKVSQAIVQYTEFDVSRVVFGKPLPNKHGGRFVSVKYRDTDNTLKELVLVLPWLRTPFGVSSFKNEKNDKNDNAEPSYSITLTLDPAQKGADKVREVLEDLHKAMVTEGETHMTEWFNGKVNKLSHVEANCYELARPARSSDGKTEYPRNFSLKFPFAKNSTEEFDVELYRDFNEPQIKVTLKNYEEYITKGCQVRGLVICNGIWITSKCSMVFRASQLQFRQGRTKIPSGLIKSVLPDSDDENDPTASDDFDDDVETASTTAESEVKVKVEPGAGNASDGDDSESDDDEQEEEEVERQPTPAAAAAKKPVQRGRKRRADGEADSTPASKR